MLILMRIFKIFLYRPYRFYCGPSIHFLSLSIFGATVTLSNRAMPEWDLVLVCLRFSWPRLSGYIRSIFDDLLRHITTINNKTLLVFLSITQMEKGRSHKLAILSHLAVFRPRRSIGSLHVP